MNCHRPWVVIGNPENRRVRFFQEALTRRGLPPALEYNYLDLLRGRKSIEDLPPNAVLRIDSPGENFDVEKGLLAAGAGAAKQEGAPRLTPAEIESLAFDRGHILPTRQWYLGFVNLLKRWDQFLGNRPDLLLCNAPAEIAVMFDKIACHQKCRLADLPVPHALGKLGSFDHLISIMDAESLPRVFLKPAHGSSATGVVALHWRRNSVEAITSVEMVRAGGEVKLYNSLKIRRHTDPVDVRELIEALLPHRVHVEEWLPKAAMERSVCDLRIVVIAGRPQQIVVRKSRSPLTNLHLGNRRGDLSQLRRCMPASQWENAMLTCEQAARCFPGSIQIALDLLFTPGFRDHYLLEINAFGDLLPNVLCEGRDAYQSQIDHVLALQNY